MSWFNLDFAAFCQALLSILFEGIPFLLLGSLISGFVDVFVPAEKMAKWLPKNTVGAVFVGAMLGIFIPICECGSVVVVRRFMKKGLPISSAIAYMIAAPVVSPIVWVSTFTAFGGDFEGVLKSFMHLDWAGLTKAFAGTGTSEMNPALFACLRLGMGFGVAVLVALVIEKLPRRIVLQPNLLGPDPAPRTGSRTGLRVLEPDTTPNGGELDFATVVGQASVGRKFVLAMQSAAADFLDVAFYFVIGAGFAALFVGINEHVFSPKENWPFVSILVLMTMAALLCLCSTTDAFVAANSFPAFPIEANLAFLVFGPMFDLKLFWLYGLIFKRRFVIFMGLFMFVLIAFVSWRLGPSIRSAPKPPPPSVEAAPAPPPTASELRYFDLEIQPV